MTLLSIWMVGFLLGMKHATEADHLAAVATLATRHGTWFDALRQGAAWGLGHTLTLIAFGGAVLLLGQTVPPRLEQFLEFCVGLMLVLLGADVLRRIRRQGIHFHAHRHGDGVLHVHAHRHSQAKARTGGAVPQFSQLQFLPLAGAADAHGPHEHAHPAVLPGRAVLVGMMHGMAGSAALILMSLGVAPTFVTGLVYILVFGLGSVLGMALLSVAIALPLRASAAALGGLHRGMTVAVGLSSCLLGLWLVYRIGVGEGLLLG